MVQPLTISLIEALEYTREFQEESDNAKKPEDCISRRKTALTHINNLRGMMQQFGEYMLEDITVLLHKVITEIPLRASQYTKSSGAPNADSCRKRINSLVALIRYLFETPMSFGRFNKDIRNGKTIEQIIEQCQKVSGEMTRTNDNRREERMIMSAADAKLYITLNTMQEACGRYLQSTEGSDNITILENRFIIAIYAYMLCARLEFMMLDGTVVTDRTEYNLRSSNRQDGFKHNFIYRNPRGEYRFIINRFKTDHEFDPIEETLNELQCRTFADLYTRVKDENRTYLFSTTHFDVDDDGTIPTVRLQDAFKQAIGVPLSVNILRKIFIRDYLSQRPHDKSTWAELANKMRHDPKTLMKDYNLSLPESYRAPEITINAAVTNRRVNRKTTQEELEVIGKTEGIYWNIPSINNPNVFRKDKIQSLLRSTEVIRLSNGNSVRPCDVFHHLSNAGLSQKVKAYKK